MTRLVELSAAAPGRPVTRARLAEKDALPPGFLDDILRSLRTGGLVRSQRGGGGGWSLARPAESITVAHVIRAVEGPLSVVRGVRPHELPAEGDPEPFVSLWIAVRASLRSVLEAVTIADLAAGELPPGVAALAANPDGEHGRLRPVSVPIGFGAENVGNRRISHRRSDSHRLRGVASAHITIYRDRMRDIRRKFMRHEPGSHHRMHGEGFGREGRRRMRRGDIRTAVLAVLAEQPRHGYEVIQALEDKTGGAWRPSAGSIYPTLQLLEDEGLARSSERDGKRVYELTEAGQAEARTRIEEAGGPPWSGAETGGSLPGRRHAAARGRPPGRRRRQHGAGGAGGADRHRRPQAAVPAAGRRLIRP